MVTLEGRFASMTTSSANALRRDTDDGVTWTQPRDVRGSLQNGAAELAARDERQRDRHLPVQRDVRVVRYPARVRGGVAAQAGWVAAAASTAAVASTAEPSATRAITVVEARSSTSTGGDTADHSTCERSPGRHGSALDYPPRLYLRFT
jgi:hypothetical protein